MVNLQDTPSAGRIWQPSPHRLLVCPPCNGDCAQGDRCPARQPSPSDACAELGADAAHSMWRHRRYRATAGLALALALALVGAAVRFAWPLVA